MLQRAGTFVERLRYTVMQKGHLYMLCGFIYQFIKEPYVSFVKCLYTFKSEIYLINGPERLIFVLLVCK